MTIASDDLVADPLHRVERVHRALEDDGGLGPPDRAQAAGLHREHVLVRSAGSRRRSSSPAAAAAGSRSTIVDLPHPDSPARPRTSPLSMSSVDAADGRHGPRLRLSTSIVRSRTRQDAHRSRSFGLRISSSAKPHIVNAEHDEHDGQPRRDEPPPLPGAGRPRAERELQDRAPRDRERVAEAEERQGGLGQDRDRDREDRVREDQRADVRQDVAGDQVPVAGAERPAPLDVRLASSPTAPGRGRCGPCSATT